MTLHTCQTLDVRGALAPPCLSANNREHWHVRRMMLSIVDPLRYQRLRCSYVLGNYPVIWVDGAYRCTGMYIGTVYRYHMTRIITHPVRRISRLVFSTARKAQTASNASMERRRRDFSKAAVFVVCAPAGFDRLGSEIRPGRCVILSP